MIFHLNFFYTISSKLLIQFLFIINEAALHIACKSGNVELAKLLLSHDGIDVNSLYEVSLFLFLNTISIKSILIRFINV